MVNLHCYTSLGKSFSKSWKRGSEAIMLHIVLVLSPQPSRSFFLQGCTNNDREVILQADNNKNHPLM